MESSKYPNEKNIMLSNGLSNISTSTPPAFFIVGCQRSGSNWLRTMLGEREDLFAPHPPHIMRDFLPILSKFGNLDKDVNSLKMLVDHVCTFVENNQVQWYDKHGRPIKFDRKAICEGAMVSVRCLRSVKMLKYATMRPEDEVSSGEDTSNHLSLAAKIEEAIIDQKYYLLAIFDEIMHAAAAANGKSIWVCKSMGMSQFHDMLLTFYGEERLRYIYLVRDPRDVCLSFMKTPVGDCHPFAISNKWARLQRHATRIMCEVPDLIHRVSYENILHNQKDEMDKINKFMGSRAICKTMRRGSVVQLKEVSQLCDGAKHGKASLNASRLSVQFRNLTRGDSFKKEQFQKWASAMDEEDMLIVESCCLEEMTSLGYDAHLVGKSRERLAFSDELTSQYAEENKALIQKMMQDLSKENPEDFERRKIQSSVLEAPTDFFSSSFSNANICPYETDDEESRTSDDSGKCLALEDNLFQWPCGASEVGFLSDEEVSQRFDLQETKTLRLGKKRGAVTLTYAAATQRGYYPSDWKKKANQDAFFAGPCFPSSTDITVPKSKADIYNSALFAVFDGHGAYGDGCATITRDIFQREMYHHCASTGDKSKSIPDDSATSFRTQDTATSSNASRHSDEYVKGQSIQQTLRNAYNKANDVLEDSDDCYIDASESGTTAVSLVFSDNGLVHIANTGDSRCLIVSNANGCNRVSISTNEHSLDDIDESGRIEKNGGLVMTSEQYDVMDGNVLSFEPKRVWSKEGKFPGCAFSRSIGDTKAKELGVIADPEIIEHEISREDCMFILGSDGIFDFISNEEVVSIASKSNDPSDACRALVGLAYKRWIYEEERADDITVIVGRITHKSRLFGLRFPSWKCTA